MDARVRDWAHRGRARPGTLSCGGVAARQAPDRDADAGRPQLRAHGGAVAAHDEDGALGLILNRPLDVPLADVAPALDALAEPGSTLHRGGPVAPESAVVLADFSDPSLAALTVFGDRRLPERRLRPRRARGRRAARARLRRALRLGPGPAR